MAAETIAHIIIAELIDFGVKVDLYTVHVREVLWQMVKCHVFLIFPIYSRCTLAASYGHSHEMCVYD